MTIGNVAWRISNSLLQRTKISTSGRYQEGILVGFHQPGWVWRVSGNYKCDFPVAACHCSLCPFVECWLFEWSLSVWHSEPETKLEGACQPALLPDQVSPALGSGSGRASTPARWKKCDLFLVRTHKTQITWGRWISSVASLNSPHGKTRLQWKEGKKQAGESRLGPWPSCAPVNSSSTLGGAS